jgi:hypothetical protein
MIISKLAVALPILLALLSVSVVDGISISVGSNDGSISTDLYLADETSLHGDISVFDEAVVGNLQASGSGRNTITYQTNRQNSNAISVTNTDGEFSLSSSAAASRNGLQLSGNLDSTGSANFAVSGAKNTDVAAQQAAVCSGVMSSSQYVIFGGGVLASQGTEISGEAGVLVSAASSSENLMVAEGGFDGGDGTINAQMNSVSAGYAAGSGNVYINGVKCLDEQISQSISSEGLNMQMEGISAANAGTVGQFGFRVTNLNKAQTVTVQKSVASAPNGGAISTGANPEIVLNPKGSSNSFVTSTRKIDQSNPIQLYLKTDAALTGEKLDIAAANQAVSLAANTWDYWTNPSQNNFFKSDVINDASKKADTYDGYSVNAFLPISGGALAYTRTYTKSNGIVTEADVCYNTKMTWTTDWNTAVKSNGGAKDFQTLALHELGHAIGLGDLYTLPNTDTRKKDYFEIMNLYTKPQHNLGSGDIKGLQLKYGE